jgi:hypothetical protein
MFADPISKISLRVRTHCAAMNHRGIIDFIALQAKELLAEASQRECPTFMMYSWLMLCVGDSLSVSDIEKCFRTHGMYAVLDFNTEDQEKYVPKATESLRVPNYIEQDWQHYDPEALADVEFEATGPRIAVKDIAKPVQPPGSETCAVCLEWLGYGGQRRWRGGLAVNMCFMQSA